MAGAGLRAPTGEAGRADAPIEAVAAERIRKVYRRMVRDGRAIDDDSPDEALHELRKRGKELRYLLELFGGLFPSDVVKPMVSALKDLQDVLGRFQDRSVQVEMLRGTADELARQPGGPGADRRRAGHLDALQADQRRARERFAGASRLRRRAAQLVRKHVPEGARHEGPRHVLDQGRGGEDVRRGQPRRAGRRLTAAAR